MTLTFEATEHVDGEVVVYAAQGARGTYKVYAERATRWELGSPAPQRQWIAHYPKTVNGHIDHIVQLYRGDDRFAASQACCDYEVREAREAKWAAFMRDHDPDDLLKHWHGSFPHNGPGLWCAPGGTE